MKDEAKLFSESYVSTKEDEAHAQRGEFLARFPLTSIGTLKLENYVIGLNGHENFCYWVEAGTKKWARVNGATAHKFGIYFGVIKSDKTPRYRYTKKYSEGLPAVGAEKKVFLRIRDSIEKLIEDGRQHKFDEIDDNPLSQMFKAKILSLYFQNDYIALCSIDLLEAAAVEFNLTSESLSQIQYDLLQFRKSSPIFKSWSNRKFAAFAHAKINGFPNVPTKKPRSKGSDKKHGTVDFERLNKLWRALGEKSEKHALAFESQRLRSLEYPQLVTKIKNRTKQPGYGYDFESFSTPGEPRYIEVKTLTKIKPGVSRFFLSENERKISLTKDKSGRYYFYLVVYDKKGALEEVLVKTAEEIYEETEPLPQSYLVSLIDQAT